MNSEVKATIHSDNDFLFTDNHSSLQLINSSNSEISDATYYRSMLFTSHVGINNLVTAAQPLLTILQRIQNKNAPENTPAFRDNICHELKAYEIRAQSFSYDVDTILLGRKILCLCLDEAMNLKKPKAPIISDENSLLVARSKDIVRGDQFFKILQHAQSEPTRYIDVLELLYMCISLGFVGKYRDLKDGKEELDKLQTQLYNCIREQRGHFKRGLYLAQRKTAVKRYKPLSLWLLSILVFSIVATLYAGFHSVLNITAQPVVKQLKRVNEQIQTPQRNLL